MPPIIDRLLRGRGEGTINRHTCGNRAVRQTKAAITIEEGILAKVGRLERGRLAEQCAKLNPACERAMADEGLSEAILSQDQPDSHALDGAHRQKDRQG
jgi:hypothetical protein